MKKRASHTGSLAAFTPTVAQWFTSAFDAPTSIQERAWSSIRQGQNTLVIAPTGSGKTFAAFLSAIDALATEDPAARQRRKGVRILYISPLKALGADIERNLQEPLASIVAQQAAETDEPVRHITTGMRTGDTTQSERGRLARNPPDILITTPESLYLMLTSKVRDTLATVQTVIVDELHALAGTKRGTHLSLSLERLDALLPEPAQRIGLSATIQPVDVAARFLGGTHAVHVVQDDAPPTFSLQVDVPVEDMTHIQPLARSSDVRSGSSSIWPAIEASVLEHVLAHTSTIVFVNSRGICERLTAHLNEAYDRQCGRTPASALAANASGSMRSEIGSTTLLTGASAQPLAKAHHGSVAKDIRQQIEHDLKTGKLRCVVATSSLELGIDMGQVDLVIQVAAPLSVSSGLQRIGRANHQVAGTSNGIIYPRTRFEVLDTACVVEGMMTGSIEETALVENALDVLAQQTAAEVSMHPQGLAPDAWLATVRKSACYQQLPESAFRSVVDMLAGAFASPDGADFAPRLDLDRQEDLMKPIPRTQKLAVSAAGTIPDRGLYPVMLHTGTQKKGRTRVGELDEEMVHESRIGDVIILGTSTWRITEITNDRVLVAPAPGRTARLPFWHGEGTGRSLDAGIRRGKLQAYLEQQTNTTGTLSESAYEHLAAFGFTANAISNLGQLIASQRTSTHAIPTHERIILETCPDETGAWYLIVHSPFGKRVNEPWALALSQRIKDIFRFDPQCAASDTGIVMRLAVEEDNAITPDLVVFAPDEMMDAVTAAIPQTSLFAARFRECSARALLMRPALHGQRTPLWQQRLRGGQLLEAAREHPRFPIYGEAMRECLHDVFDLDGACWLMSQIEAERIAIQTVRTDAPSAFASPLLFGYVADHLYDGDMPHAERTRALLSVDPQLLSELLGTPDQLALIEPAATAAVQLALQRLTPDRKLAGAEGTVELLRQMGPVTEGQVEQRLVDGAEARALLRSLEEQHRACPVTHSGRTLWATPEDAIRIQALTGAAVPTWAEHWSAAADLDDERLGPAAVLAAKFLQTHALSDADQFAQQLGVGPAVAQEALEQLRAAGTAVKLPVSHAGQAMLEEARALLEVALQNQAQDGLAPTEAAHLLPPQADVLWAAKDMLRRLRVRSRNIIEAAAQPVSAARFQALVLALQRVGGTDALSPLDDLAECIALFEGTELSASVWETILFPARVPGYKPTLLDELLESEEVIWVVASDGQKTPALALYPTDSPFAPLPVDPSTKAWPDAAEVPHQPSEAAPHPLEREICTLIGEEGPLAFAAVVRRLQEMSADEAVSVHEVAQAIQRLATQGCITSTSFACMRARALEGTPKARTQAPRRVSSRRQTRTRTALSASRREARAEMVAAQQELDGLAGMWRALIPAEVSQTEQAMAHVESLLDTHGVICPKTIEATGRKGGMQALYTVLRSMEDAGEVIRGEFVCGLGASQFARRHTVESLRTLEADEGFVVLDAVDPAMLYGSVLPWPDASAGLIPQNRTGCLVVLHEGAPVLFATKRIQHLIALVPDRSLWEPATEALISHLKEQLQRSRPSQIARKLIVQQFNGQDVYGSPMQEVLADLGLMRDTHGMRLYIQPF